MLIGWWAVQQQADQEQQTTMCFTRAYAPWYITIILMRERDTAAFKGTGVHRYHQTHPNPSTPPAHCCTALRQPGQLPTRRQLVCTVCHVTSKKLADRPHAPYAQSTGKSPNARAAFDNNCSQEYTSLQQNVHMCAASCRSIKQTWLILWRKIAFAAAQHRRPAQPLPAPKTHVALLGNSAATQTALHELPRHT